MRISDWSSDVCSSVSAVVDEGGLAGDAQGVLGIVADHHHGEPALLLELAHEIQHLEPQARVERAEGLVEQQQRPVAHQAARQGDALALAARSEEHTSELQSLMRISYAVLCLTKKKKT